MHQWLVQGLDGLVNEIIYNMVEKEQIPVSDDLIRETDRFWEDPQRIMTLIDLLFLWEDEERKRICS